MESGIVENKKGLKIRSSRKELGNVEEEKERKGAEGGNCKEKGQVYRTEIPEVCDAALLVSAGCFFRLCSL